MATTTTDVLNQAGYLTSFGEAGELYIGGPQVARGYLQRAAFTAERFVPHPYSSEPGARMYRTGDRVRYQSDGNLEFLGRLDHQVKVRGFRIELGEIEVALRQQSEIQEAVVVVQEDEEGEKQLVAFVIPTATSALDLAILRADLKRHLPDYMVPGAFVVLAAFPLTPNNKIDQQALPAPTTDDRIQGQTYVAPRTPLEEILVTIWQDILKLVPIGIHENFFELGGHSLLATQLIGRLNQQVQIDLPLRTMFDWPILADQASAIEEFLLQEMTHLTDSKLDQGMATKSLITIPH
ncbi:MAG: hypothetical protein E4H32_08690 [Nitrospirales bacterium]|nr:MAG: hypothetical protein E4H32_08690 [Nitrospirales bacterium]